MTDAERSIETSLAAFAEFHSVLSGYLSRGLDAKARIASQVSRGRILTTQVIVNCDFAIARDCASGSVSPDQVDGEMQKAAELFNEWRDSLADAVTQRRDGWLRLMIAVDAGRVVSANMNPSFDYKIA